MASIRFDSGLTTVSATRSPSVCDDVAGLATEESECGHGCFEFRDEGDRRRGAWRRFSDVAGEGRRTVATPDSEEREHSTPKRQSDRLRPYHFESFAR